MEDYLVEIAHELRRAGLVPRQDCSLAEHTTFAIGGCADLYVTTATQAQLIDALTIANSYGHFPFLLGGGSNILVGDGGIAGLVIKDGTSGWSKEHDKVYVASGTWLTDVVETLAAEGIGGLEFLAGIPGTLGGAVCGNAGAYGQSISERLLSIRVLRNGVIEELAPSQLGFAYRTSTLKQEALSLGSPRTTILGATLRVELSPPTDPAQRVTEILAHRASRLPPRDLGCAGSYFKNLPPPTPGAHRIAAGKLLDELGAKGRCHGGAQVYEGHANIIVNRGGATACDVLSLAEELKTLVRQSYAIELEAEVMTIGRVEPCAPC